MIFKNKIGFTFIELIVAITIIVILSAIGFASLGGYNSYARDAERNTDLSQLSTALKTFKSEKGYYPFPNKYFSLTNSGTVVALQGKMSKLVGLSTIDDIPLDPKIKIPYLYSISLNKQEFQLSATLENDDGDKEIALSIGSYKSVAKNILPSLILAYDGTTGDLLEIHDGIGNGSNNRKLFIFNGQSENLPYDFTTLKPSTNNPDFDVLLKSAENNNYFYQNSSFSTCEEVFEAGKSIGDGDYELRTDTGSLTSSGCTF